MLQCMWPAEAACSVPSIQKEATLGQEKRQEVGRMGLAHQVKLHQGATQMWKRPSVAEREKDAHHQGVSLLNA